MSGEVSQESKLGLGGYPKFPYALSYVECKQDYTGTYTGMAASGALLPHPPVRPQGTVFLLQLTIYILADYK